MKGFFIYFWFVIVINKEFFFYCYYNIFEDFGFGMVVMIFVELFVLYLLFMYILFGFFKILNE